MNRKAVLYALAYCVLVIVFKLVIIFGNYSLTKFGYYYSTITAVFMVVPFYYLAIKDVRDNNYGGIIAGKEAMRIALTLFAVSAIITSVYHYFEYQYVGKQLAIEYYNSQQFIDFLKSRTPVKPDDYQKIIQEQINGSEGAAFKATTGKLFSFMLVGLSAAFICAVLMKRSPASVKNN